MDQQKRNQVIDQLAQVLHNHKLAGAARLFLETTEPLAFIASQIALFARPLTPYGRWRDYVDVLADEDGWHMLKESIDK